MEAKTCMSKLLSLVAVLCLAATLAFGQAADRPASTTDRQDGNALTATRTDDAPRNDRNWGWIGIFGLAGLAGLAGRRKHEDHRIPKWRLDQEIAKHQIRDRDRDATRMRPAS